jgi:DUF218 domain
VTDEARTITDADRAAAHIIWDYHQLGHELQPCSAAIALGSHDLGVAAFAANLYHQGLFPLLVVSGADNPTMAHLFPRGEAEHFRERAVELGVPESSILTEPQATNTGQNIEYSRDLLRERGVEVQTLMLISMPYMQRRAYATCRKVWSEITPLCASEPLGFDAYVKSIGDEAMVIDQLVGDLQRIIEYPSLGFAVSQKVPTTVHEAFTYLIEQRYISRLLKD